MKKRRAKNLSCVDIKQIVEILDGWSSAKLTWNMLIDQIAVRNYCRYTRQALYKHERIRNAFDLAKKYLSRDGGQIRPASSRSYRLRYSAMNGTRLKTED